MRKTESLAKSQSNPTPNERGRRKTTARSSRGPGRPTLSNEELLEKALDLFLEHGFERTSIDAITAAAGMAKRTVYLRYPDKMALFKAALLRAIENWILPTEALRAAESEDLEETLLRIGRVLVANIMTPAGIRLLRITNAESNRMPEIGAYTYKHGTERTLLYLANLFRQRLGIGEADAKEAAIAYLYLVVCGPPTMTAWGMALDQDTIDQHTTFCVRLFLRGLLPRDALAGADDVFEFDKSDENPAAPRDMRALQDENRRLRNLLLSALLDADRLKERSS